MCEAPDVEALVHGIEREYGRFDITVNNAAITHTAPLHELSLDPPVLPSMARDREQCVVLEHPPTPGRGRGA